MPVHLGSMDARSRPSSARTTPADPPGDVYVLNAPYNGGTHLPDITVCTPVFDDDGKRDPVLGRLARPSRRYRRHLAGSMSPLATHDRGGRRLYRQLQAGRRGRFRERGADDAADRREISGAQPPEHQRPEGADRRQREGRAGAAQDGRALRPGRGRAYMGHVQDNAAESVRRVLDRLPDGEFEYEMDQGTDRQVKITVDKAKREATVDFTGTSPQRPTTSTRPSR
jgi:5-oxoprolinase (ATP-hydrolysing)